MIHPGRIIALGALIFAAACQNSDPLVPRLSDRPLFQPQSGNGGKEVFSFDDQLPGFTTCPSGATLDVHVVGWLQAQTTGSSSDEATLWTYNFTMTYSNWAGATYVWHQVGTNRFYVDGDGNLVVALAGRAGFDWGIEGRFVLNLVTGEFVSISGREVFAADLACAALGA